MARLDLILDSNQDLQNDSGDFKTGDGSVHMTERLIIADLGHYKVSPKVGVGIFQYLGAPGNLAAEVEGKIVTQMKADGFKTPKVDASDMDDIQVNTIHIKS